MAVVAQHPLLLADHEGELAVRLESDEAVHDVHARLLELARPDDVVGLVEARLHLDESENLLAGLCRVDERLDDRAVARRAVQRLLDGQNVGILRRLLEEALHTRRERLVGVVHEHIRLADRGEDVAALGVVARLEGERRRGQVRRVVQIGAIDARQIEQAAQVERPRQAVDLLLGDVEFVHQELECEVVHVVGDLEADGRSEAPAHELGLERLDEVLGLVLLDHEILVAREAERVMIEHLHPREQVAEVVGDEVLERQIPHPVVVARDLNEPREHGRHLQPRELLTAGSGVADADRQVQRQPGDVREGVRRVDRERHEHGEDLGLEVGVELRPVVVVERIVGEHLDAVAGHRGLHQIGPRRGMTHLKGVRLGGDVGEHLVGRAPDVGGHRQSRDDAALEAGDAHHEELVEVTGEDREEVRPLQERCQLVLGKLQHALVEGEPAHLPIEVAVLGQLRIEALGLVEVIVVGIAETGIENLWFDHPLIIAGRR